MEPALTAEEWERRAIGSGSAETARIMDGEGPATIEVTEDLRWFRDDEIPALIALSNHALPDSDPRKITRESIDALRALYQMGCCCGVITPDDNKRWEAAQEREPQLLAALESYLPPEGA